MRNTRNLIYPFFITVTLLVFYPILGNDFQYYWDDNWMVMNEYTEGGLNMRNLRLILTGIYHGQYAPVNHLVFLFLYSAGGYNPFIFHLYSLLLHMACVCFVYAIILRLFEQSKRTPGAVNAGNIRVIACITTLFFAIHPLNVESVAWISAVKILHYAFFYLLATLSWLAYLKKRRNISYIVTVVLFILSLASKDQAVTFPVWLLLVYFILGYDLKGKKVWFSLLPFFLLSLLAGLMTIRFAGRNEFNVEDFYPLWQRLVLACYSLVEYFTKYIIPYKLLYIYPFPMAAGEPLPTWVLVYPALVVVFFIALKNQLLKNPYVYGVLFFLVHIAITLHIIPLSRFAVIADRYIYLAGIGLSFIGGYLFTKWKSRLKGKVKTLPVIVFILLFIYLGVYSNLRCREWQDSDTIKKEFLEMRKKYPSLEKEWAEMEEQKNQKRNRR